MSRALRVEYAAATYHVMGRGVARMRVFHDDADRETFLENIAPLVGQGCLVVYAYCLMPNHYHLLCMTPDGQLGRWMRDINGNYSRRFNRRHRRVGHLWQGRYRAIVVEEQTYLAECSRYIHLNPNRSKLTRPAERYRWSSYCNYVGGPTAVPWVETGPLMRMFGQDKTRYRQYVEGGKGEKAVSPFERAVAGIALGTESFVQRVRERVRAMGQQSTCPSLRELRRLGRAGPEQVEKAVEEMFPAERERRKQVIRMYALRVHSGLRPVEVARRCGKGPSAVSMAVRRIEELAVGDEALALGLQRLAGLLAETEGADN